MTKNTKNIVLDACSILLGILTIVMMIVPFFKQYSSGEIVLSRNIFSLIDFSGEVKMLIAITSLILAIIVCAFVILAVLKLLNSLNVIKNETFNKSVNIAALVCAIIVAIAMIVIVIAIVMYCNDNWYADYQSGLRPVVTSMVFATIFALATIATSTVNVKNN